MRTLSWKQQLALSVNRIPKAAVYPYGKLKCVIAGNPKARARRAFNRYCILDMIVTKRRHDAIRAMLRDRNSPPNLCNRIWAMKRLLEKYSPLLTLLAILLFVVVTEDFDQTEPTGCTHRYCN